MPLCVLSLSSSYSTEEKASVDEAFLDLSIPVRDELLRRYPYLANPPAEVAESPDTPLPTPPRVSLHGHGNLVPIDPSAFEKDEKLTNELVEEAEKDHPTTWHDVGLQIAAELMTNIRREVHERLGYLTSAVSSQRALLHYIH